MTIAVDQLGLTQGSDGLAPYCFGSGEVGVPRVPLAGLPVAYLSGEGEAGNIRSWTFVNTQPTEYRISTVDSLDTAAVQAQNNSVLARFRPDNVQPWAC